MKPAPLTGHLLVRKGLGERFSPPGRREAARVSVQLDRARHLRAKLAAVHAGTSMAAILEEALRRHLDRLAPPASAAGGGSADHRGEADAPAARLSADMAARPGRRYGSS